ncbi:proline-rich protein PRCC isoform 2-T2 [Salvelinus alpinus]|uniref:proline-rich protein PRCC-like isoform X2 n=1 Tax=Salvelinus alpinus TaxID=8036 RepID=UPI0039FCC0ED
MSLVAYASSDDSDSDETSNVSSIVPGSKRGGLFARIPVPKRSASEALGKVRPSKGTSHFSSRNTVSNDGDEDSVTRSQHSKGGLLFDLPKPKKRTEPVKIPIPEIKRGDSDSDEDEPRRKKSLPQGPGTGLSSLLPQPKNMVVKEMQRALVPHTLTKRPEPKKPTKPSLVASQGHLSSSASPSAIKAAAKSAALQLARQIAAEESDEELAPENYFSLEDSAKPLPAVVPSLNPEPVPTSGLLPAPPGMQRGTFQSDAPLEFGANQEGAWGGQQLGVYQQPSAEPQGYYNEAYYQDPESDPALPEPEQPSSSALFDDEAFMRLQGKRNRSKEEVKFLEIKGDDQLSGNQQWMTKSMTEEKQERKSFSKKKGDQPTGQQRRKHQITYLIHQAKERELELKNNWADNKLTRRQTQAKYGF